jgi:thymidylate synthase (FAD)
MTFKLIEEMQSFGLRWKTEATSDRLWFTTSLYGALRFNLPIKDIAYNFPQAMGAVPSLYPGTVFSCPPTQHSWDEWLEETPATLHIKVPIFVDRQLVKHSLGFTRNEVSRRYVDTPPEHHIPAQWRSRPPQNIKQGSGRPLALGDARDISHLYEHLAHTAELHYKTLTDRKGPNVAPEQARVGLLLSCYTEYYLTASLYNWARLYHLRRSPHAQQEIREYALAIDAILTKLHPKLWPIVRDTPQVH